MIKDIEQHNEAVTINQKEIAVLKELFPSCFTKDGSLDFTKLKEQLNDKVDIINEGYELKFLGKSYAKLLASIDTTTLIKPNEEHNQRPENQNSENIYISGDNLDGLKHLLKSYSKQVKCIYIDPPYNTGSDGFVYNDNFNFGVGELQTKLSIDDAQAQRILDLTKRNSASHSAWLLFMYSRLKLARDLLTNDGVIFISIDDNEQANLKLLCDDVFGEENSLGSLPTIMNLKGNNDEFGFAGTHEYTEVYCRNKEKALLFEFNIDEEENEKWDEDHLGFFKKGANLKATGGNGPRSKRPNLYYPILVDLVTKTVSSIPREEYEHIYCKTTKEFDDVYVEQLKGKYEEIGFAFLLPESNNEKMSWRWKREKIIDEPSNIIITGEDSSFGIYKKQRPSLGDLPSKKPKTILYKPEYSSGNGTEQLKTIFQEKLFSNPKPINLILDFISIGCDKNDIILDFFSGSATTAHAVMQLNAEDGGSRKFISVQLPEVLSSNNPQQKAAFDFLTANNRPTTLDYIGFERIIRASEKIKAETNADIDYGFKHFELCEANQNTLDKCEAFDKTAMVIDANILDEFGTSTVLTTWLVNDGYGFNAKVQTIELKGYTAYYCINHLYLINPHLTQEAVAELYRQYEEVASFNPKNIVMFGYSFTEWSVTDMLEKNLRILESSEKNLTINLDVRY